MLGLDDEQYRTFSFDEFKSAYFKILSDGEIMGDFPEMTYRDSTGYFTVRLPLRTRPSLRLKIGGNISSTQLQQAYFGVEYQVLALRAHTFHFDGNFSGIYTSVQAGWRTDFRLKGPVYFDLFFHYNRYNYKKGPSWTTFEKYGYHGYHETFLSSSFGFPLGRSSALQVRAHAGIDQFFYYERGRGVLGGYGTSERTRFQFAGAQVEATKRTLNYPLFATRGIWQSVSAVAIEGRETFTPGDQFRGEVPAGRSDRRWVGGKYTREEYFPFGKRFSAGYLIEAAFVSGPQFHNDHATNFLLPGFMPTPYSQALYLDGFRSDSYLGAGVMPTIEFADNFYLKNGFYLYMPGDRLLEGPGQPQKMRHIFSSSLVYQTPVGPASLTLTNIGEASRRWFLAFNLGFTLFNRRGIFY
jgi:NTE family protein